MNGCFDYFGSERVLEQLLRMVLNADPFAVLDFLRDDLRHLFRTNRLQRLFIQASFIDAIGNRAEIVARELQIPPMVYDSARPKVHFLNKTDDRYAPAPCLYMKDPHKVVLVYGLAIGGL